jgi:Spy/CpxP family protein refolding chaperone
MRLTTVLVGIALVGGLTFAQGQGPGRQRGSGTPPGGANQERPAMDPARGIEMRVTMLTRFLELTPDQVPQATTIFTNAATASQTLRTASSENRTVLRGAIKANNFPAIDQAANALGIASGQLMAIDAKAEAAFYAILTADQKAKFDQRGGMGFGGGGGPMGPGGMGPGGMGGRMPRD